MAMHRSILSFLMRPIARNLQLIPRIGSIHTSANLCGYFDDKEYVYPADDPDVMDDFRARVFKDLKVEDYEELIHYPEDREKIAQILKDYEFLKYTTDRAPTDIPVRKMAEMLKMESASQKMNYFNYLFKTELAKLASKRARAKIGHAHMEKIKAQKDYPTGLLFDPDTNEPIYRKWHNSFVMRIPDSKMDAVNDSKKQIAATFGQPFVVDFSFDTFMTRREQLNTVDQMSILYGHNYRQKPDIFDLWFCNLKKSSFMFERMQLTMPNVAFPNSMISLEEGSYLDIFPREKLVYLTPHANNMLREFSDNDIYVMAGLVDKTIKSPVSLAKAKREGIRFARLPIDEHVIWGCYSKVLTLNQIHAIMLEVKNNGGDWKDAFLKHIPKRKLKSREDIAQEEFQRLEKMTFKKKKFFRLT